ncbi:hypothetical protein PIB30_070095 [Stylosanthes scabra]|uniref:Uncharacterized protein n=1 Tax=Stylosanthes scabra TaxID=79078 RepID=A0ABU6TP88_9FABA|nr:hypothetical protein [Stylosanthes scabra]
MPLLFDAILLGSSIFSSRLQGFSPPPPPPLLLSSPPTSISNPPLPFSPPLPLQLCSLLVCCGLFVPLLFRLLQPSCFPLTAAVSSSCCRCRHEPVSFPRCKVATELRPVILFSNMQRLFLTKHTPPVKLDKKHFAKGARGSE